jgi:predicted TIM-barrel fold metal-dependent hydrolase
MQNAKIIDADGHVQDRDADIRACMEEPYCRRQGPLVAKDKWDSSMYGKLGKDVADVPTRLRDMDQEGIEVSVLFPTSAFGITQSPEKDYAAAFCCGYNDWIAGVCKESPRLRGIGLVPFQDVPAAVAEVNRAITKLGLAGIAIASFT